MDEDQQEEKKQRLKLAIEEYFRTYDKARKVNLHWTIGRLSSVHNVAKSTLSKHIALLTAGKTPQKIGRPPIFSSSLKQAFKLDAQFRDLSKNSHTNKTIKPELQKRREKEIIDNGGNIYSLTNYSYSTYVRFRKEILPEIVNTGVTQNQRRYEALIDIRNHISLAVMWKAILSEDNQFESPAHLYNFDATTLLLETSSDDKITLFLAEGSKKYLKELGLNPSTTLSREGASFKKRAITCISLTRADGFLSAIVIKIKDGSFKECTLHKLTTYETYEIYVIAIPSVKYSKNVVNNAELLQQEEFLDDLDENDDGANIGDNSNNNIEEITTSKIIKSAATLLEEEIADYTIKVFTHCIRSDLKNS
jgi:hypothetical protein